MDYDVIASAAAYNNNYEDVVSQTARWKEYNEA